MKKTLLSVIAAGLLLAGTATYSQGPERNISGRRHPNLAAAQKLSRQAYERISEAQRANEFDMEGHAQRAKDLLEQVNAELKAAAEAANRNR
jgi:hypothetical protein